MMQAWNETLSPPALETDAVPQILMSLDTNVLFHSIDSQAGEKHVRAQQIVQQVAYEERCILTMQSLCEFYAATTRKGKLSHVEASARVQAWRTLFPVFTRTPDCLTMALEAVENHSLSFWDAMLWATAQQAGVRILLSEDLQNGRVLGDVQFRNPFTSEDPFRER